MFVYFIQKKGFLDGDADYLRNRMKQDRETKDKDKFDTGPMLLQQSTQGQCKRSTAPKLPLK